MVVPGLSVYEMGGPTNQREAGEAEGGESDGLSLIEEKGNLKYRGSENVSQFPPVRENEETIGWSSSESEDNYIENDDILEQGEIDYRFLPHSENEDNPSSDSEDVI